MQIHWLGSLIYLNFGNVRWVVLTRFRTMHGPFLQARLKVNIIFPSWSCTWWWKHLDFVMVRCFRRVKYIQIFGPLIIFLWFELRRQWLHQPCSIPTPLIHIITSSNEFLGPSNSIRYRNWPSCSIPTGFNVDHWNLWCLISPAISTVHARYCDKDRCPCRPPTCWKLWCSDHWNYDQVP